MKMLSKKFLSFSALLAIALSTNSFAGISVQEQSENKQIPETQTKLSPLDRSIIKPVLKPNSCGEPVYPATSRRDNEEGKVGVELRINESGNVVDARVAVSSGFAALDEGAIKFLSNCKFEPAIKNGGPVAVWYPVYHRWRLADSPEQKLPSEGNYSFEDKTPPATFMSQFKESCSLYVSSFNNSETESFESVNFKKITEAEVCSCAETLIKADKYLKPFTVENAPDVEKTMDIEIFTAYTARKTTAVIFECTAKALEESIGRLDPPKNKRATHSRILEKTNWY
ncbi:energy transducer TonB [Cellvibrio sp.]|uniref:energy transducer TonB n=1 Tax=Cellvibrio sp. TaxID=1965322 RepID=UPI003964848E